MKKLKVKDRTLELDFARKICANFGVDKVETLSLMDCLYRLSSLVEDSRKELMRGRPDGRIFPVEVTDAAKEN